ncbi:MAG TPA: aspartate kinase [Rhabdochlamydiaceae bacterium]|jgi:aspartate kinase
MDKEIVIMKFGGASVVSSAQFGRIAQIIIEKEQTARVVVVVSAMQGATDQLLAMAEEVHPHPPLRELDMLVSVGERISIALLAMALHLKGRDAMSFTGSQSGIVTTADHADARILTVKPQRILQALESGKVAIVAGFQGVSAQGEITTLGRGGSDTTAVALGVALKASRVKFYKDVEGIYSADPKKCADAVCYPSLSYEEAVHIAQNGGKVLHERCIALAAKNEIPLHVLSFHDPKLQVHAGTFIGMQGGERLTSCIYEEGLHT